jgi:hypothetical protein
LYPWLRASDFCFSHVFWFLLLWCPPFMDQHIFLSREHWLFLGWKYFCYDVISPLFRSNHVGHSWPVQLRAIYLELCVFFLSSLSFFSLVCARSLRRRS